MFRRFILRFFYKLIRKSPADMPMVKYWKHTDHVEAKLTVRDGSTVMVMDGEDHPIWGFPRGHLLIPQSIQHGPLSKLKHEIKNQIFNESWGKLEVGIPREQVIQEAMARLQGIYVYLEPLRYDLMPPGSMAPAVREIHRALTRVGCPDALRDILTLILQEDDGYRYRVQWLAIWIPWFGNPVKVFDKALQMVEHAEIVGDMKGRIKLLRRILMLLLEDQKIKEMFIKFFKEVNWKKVRISEADRYHFRGKYFKVDSDILEY